MEWALIFLSLNFFSLWGFGHERPEWRPDGNVVACAHIPVRSCESHQVRGWPNQNALLIGTSPKEVPAFPGAWEEFKYF